MRKALTVLTTIFVLSLSITACTSEKTEDTHKEEVMEEPGEVMDVGSLEELNEVLGSKLSGPAAMGVNDISFLVIGEGENQVASYTFSIGAYTYEYRATKSASEEVITGVTEDGDTEYPNTNDEIAWKTTENYKLAWWLGDEALSYGVVVEDHGEMDMEEFQDAVNELCSFTK